MSCHRAYQMPAEKCCQILGLAPTVDDKRTGHADNGGGLKDEGRGSKDEGRVADCLR